MIKKRKPVDIGFDADSDLLLFDAKQRRTLPLGEIGSFEWTRRIHPNEDAFAANVVKDLWKRSASFDIHSSLSDVDDDGGGASPPASPSNFASMPAPSSTRTESSPPPTQTPSPPPPPPINNTATTTETVVSSAVSALAETITTTKEIHDARLALMQMQRKQAMKELEVELVAAKKTATACRTAFDNEAAERDEANKLLDAEQAAHNAAKEKITQLEHDKEACRSSMEAHIAILRNTIEKKHEMEEERAALLARAEKAESELQRALERIKTLESDAAADAAGKQPAEFGVPARKRIRDFSGKPRALVVSGGHIEEERAAEEARSAEYTRLNMLFVDAGEVVRTLTARLYDCEARIDAFCIAMHAGNARALDAKLLDLYVAKNNTWNELLCAIHEETCARLRFNEAKKNVDLLQTGVLYQLHRSEHALEIRASPETPEEMNI